MGFHNFKNVLFEWRMAAARIAFDSLLFVA